jgi:histidyl-tRNA synthetase
LTYRNIKGTRDILPSESWKWQRVEERIRTVMHSFNFREIRTPIFEETPLFSRSIGELTDIVTKEMYSFPDRGGDSLTLRPEMTASVARAYIQHNLGRQLPLVKVYYQGPMFRQERPQAGRLRQFHQFGAEAIGSMSPDIDVETISLALAIYETLNVKNVILKINSVGCEKCRPAYKEKLIRALEQVRDRLSPESQNRLSANPLRILDSKSDQDRFATQHAPLMRDHLCVECKSHYASVKESLQDLGIKYEEDGRLVRGLDYYTKTAFEILSKELGAQDALAGGGRYDLLIEELGGNATPAIGFAAGMERLMMVLEKQDEFKSVDENPTVFIAALDAKSHRWAMQKALALRMRNISVELDHLGRSLKAQMREADRLHVRYVIIIGEAEVSSGKVLVKDMKTGAQQTVGFNDIDQELFLDREKR